MTDFIAVREWTPEQWALARHLQVLLLLRQVRDQQAITTKPAKPSARIERIETEAQEKAA